MKVNELIEILSGLNPEDTVYIDAEEFQFEILSVKRVFGGEVNIWIDEAGVKILPVTKLEGCEE